MIVLGIDPGLANAGYGVVARRRGRLTALDGGVIDTSAGLALEARLATVHARVLELIDEHTCDVMALEQLYFGANVQTAFAVGHARGVTMLAAGERGLPCFSYTPQRVKSAVCGNGRAPKEQVARMVQTLLYLPELPRPDHAADALAVAICHHNAAPLAGALAAAQIPTPASAAAGRAAGALSAVERPAARARARVPARGGVGVPR
jgi:crossover junction endodeoxyribonuclease RuvC